MPYSVNFTKNAYTFKHITDGVALPAVPTLPGGPNSEVHNAGEIWTTMLWEGYVALQKARVPRESFDDVRRRMADYVVAGLKMAPPDATYTEQRDAILSAAAAARHHADDDVNSHDPRPGAADLLALATAFARRGAVRVPSRLRAIRRISPASSKASRSVRASPWARCGSRRPSRAIATVSSTRANEAVSWCR